MNYYNIFVINLKMNTFDDDDADRMDNGLSKFKSYEDYLDDQLEDEDLFYLEDKELAR